MMFRKIRTMFGEGENSPEPETGADSFLPPSPNVGLGDTATPHTQQPVATSTPAATLPPAAMTMYEMAMLQMHAAQEMMSHFPPNPPPMPTASLPFRPAEIDRINQMVSAFGQAVAAQSPSSAMGAMVPAIPQAPPADMLAVHH